MQSLLAAVFALHAVANLGGQPAQLFKNGRPTVVVFVRTDCPISNRYAPEVNRLFQKYSGRVDFYLVYPDAAETADAIRKHVADYGYQAEPLRDARHELVGLAKAQVTPEGAVFSRDGRLLYHGRIDNRYIDFGKYMPAPTRHDLEEAIDAVLAGEPVKEPVTRAIGCSLADVQ